MKRSEIFIFLGADHAGFELKEIIKRYLELNFVKFKDLSPHNQSTDYPIIAKEVAASVLNRSVEENIQEKLVLNFYFGILICGSGIGVSIAANRFKGIRAALCTSVYHAEMARKHNDANILCLGGRVTNFELTKEILETFLSAEFESGRHALRIEKIEKNLLK
jgi:ribose 5-phosphate isomerase B